MNKSFKLFYNSDLRIFKDYIYTLPPSHFPSGLFPPDFYHRDFSFLRFLPPGYFPSTLKQRRYKRKLVYNGYYFVTVRVAWECEKRRGTGTCIHSSQCLWTQFPLSHPLSKIKEYIVEPRPSCTPPPTTFADFPAKRLRAGYTSD